LDADNKSDLQGAVLIHLKEAKDLPAADSNGLSDPYAILKLGKESKKSLIQYDTLSPMWNEKFEFVKVGHHCRRHSHEHFPQLWKPASHFHGTSPLSSLRIQPMHCST
jgi:hypothetical protein